jgi:hypothetical protein
MPEFNDDTRMTDEESYVAKRTYAYGIMRKHFIVPKPGFGGCQFCAGRGCLACEAEERKAYNAFTTPVFEFPLIAEDDVLRMNDEGCPNCQEIDAFSLMSPDDEYTLRRVCLQPGIAIRSDNGPRFDVQLNVLMEKLRRNGKLLDGKVAYA